MHKFRDSPASSSGSSSNHSDEGNHEEYPMLARNESPNHPPLSRLRKKQQIYLACIIFAITSTLVYFATSIYKPVPSEIVEEHAVDDDSSQPLLSHPQIDLLDPSFYLNGPPAQSFRDNLRTDAKYITSWLSAGWTNDVMTYINLIYLGLITDRIPIIAMFTPSHIGGDKPTIDFGEIFDVQRLSQAIKMPVLEWHQVKNRSSSAVDELGCWSVWQAVQDREEAPRGSVVPNYLNLDISYTKAPTWIKVIPHYEHDQHAYFWAIATLGFPEARQENLQPPRESPSHHVLLPPDEQLLCYDYLYYVCAHQPYEFEFDYSPAWRFVGQHLRWTARLETIADGYIRAAFGTSDGETTPPYIGIHLRHGDFKVYCGEYPIEDCFPSIPTIARRVDEIKVEVLESRGITIGHVIVTSDERDGEWWKKVTDQGWYKIDHSGTAETYGAWYPVLIDAVIQSNGIGFIGTDRSTMSTVARRRVQSWRNGVVRTLKWGKPGADDH